MKFRISPNTQAWLYIMVIVFLGGVWTGKLELVGRMVRGLVQFLIGTPDPGFLRIIT